jgi:hypothetical protein
LGENMKALRFTFLVLLSSVFAAATESPPAYVPPDFRIFVVRPNGSQSGETIVRRKNSAEAIARIESVEGFRRFIAQMKKEERIDWGIGCVIGPFVERDADGRERKSKDGGYLFFLPLGDEKLSLSDAIAMCAANGVKFTYNYGF